MMFGQSIDCKLHICHGISVGEMINLKDSFIETHPLNETVFQCPVCQGIRWD